MNLERATLSAYLVFLVLSAIICSPFVSKIACVGPQEALAQPAITSYGNTSATNNSFLTYQNKSTLGIAIQYPFNWKRIEADHDALIFLPPSKKDAFSEKLTVAVFGINSSVSTGQLASGAINNYGDQYRDFFIINSKPIAFGGNQAYLLLYTYTDPGAGKIVAMDIGFKDGNRAYIISYSAQQIEYNTYVSTVVKMIDSFRVIAT